MNLLNEYQQDKFDKVQRKENLIDKIRKPSWGISDEAHKA